MMKKDYKFLTPTPVDNSMKISNRIYALVAFCLGLLALVSGISIWQMHKISTEIEGISFHNIPLTEDLTQITIHQLEQSITFDRAFHAGEVMDEHASAKSEFSTAIQIFTDLTAKIEKEFEKLQVVSRSALAITTAQDERQEYQSLLKIMRKLDANYKDYDQQSKQAFKLIKAGQIEQARALLPKIESEEDNLNLQLESLLMQVNRSTRRAVSLAQQHEDFALKLLVILTNAALLIGTGAAVVMVRRRLARPLREIVTGLDALSSCDMSVDVKVYCDDEIGAVARSYEVFKHSLVRLQRREEELHNSEMRFKDIAEISSDWIWECDKNLRFTYCSERFTELIGLPKEKLMGKTRHELGMNSIADWDTHQADLKARRPFHEFGYSIKDKTGETLHLEISGRPVFDADGSFKGYRGTGSDRTAEFRIQAELVRHRDHLQELVDTATQELKVQAVELREALSKEKGLNELQSQFVSMASHEFRTPLAIIDSSAQRLKKSVDISTHSDAMRRVDKIRSAVRRMTKLMESTLNAARLDEGKITIEIGICSVKKTICDACTNIQELAKNHNIACEIIDLPKVIKADAGALDQVLTNLLSNAIKYAPDAPDILIKAFTSGDHIIIKVRDHGIGIDKDDMTKMFGKFFRAKTSVGISGTGIGLYLTKTLVEMHGGSISLQSIRGEGSTFTVRLPIAGPSKAAQAA